MSKTILTITTRINARRKLVWFIEGRFEKTYASERQARQGAASIIAYEQAAALDIRVATPGLAATLFPNPFDRTFGLVAQARRNGIAVREFEVVVR